MTSRETADRAPVSVAAAIERSVTGSRGSRGLDPAWRIEPLWQGAPEAGTEIRGGQLPGDLRSRFDGRIEIPLRPDRPTIVANFVATLDGVVAFDRSGTNGGAEVSGSFEPDRFLMAVLRSLADAVLVGAGTVRATPNHAWTPRRIHQPSANGLATWRNELGVPSTAPTTVIVTASGDVDADRVASRDPDARVVVVTTDHGAARLAKDGATDAIEVIAMGSDADIPAEALRAFVADRGWRVVLSEAGPTLFGALLGAAAIDELFLTLAPQVAGRSDEVARLGLVEGVGFAAASAPWWRLRGVLRCSDHLFLRYAVDRPAGPAARSAADPS